MRMAYIAMHRIDELYYVNNFSVWVASIKGDHDDHPTYS